MDDKASAEMFAFLIENRDALMALRPYIQGTEHEVTLEKQVMHSEKDINGKAFQRAYFVCKVRKVGGWSLDGDGASITEAVMAAMKNVREYLAGEERRERERYKDLQQDMKLALSQNFQEFVNNYGEEEESLIIRKIKSKF